MRKKCGIISVYNLSSSDREHHCQSCNTGISSEMIFGPNDKRFLDAANKKPIFLLLVAVSIQKSFSVNLWESEFKFQKFCGQNY